VTETDIAGNIGTPASLTFTLIRTAPKVTVALVADTGISATDRITSNPALSGTANPNASVLVSIDGAPGVAVATNAAGAWTFTPVGLAQGLHNVLVTDTDLAGNVGTGTLAFTLDTTAPATPVLSNFTFVATATALTSYTLSGTAEAGSTVVLSNGGAVPLGTVTAAANGAWTFTLTPGTPTNILSRITATATDIAGNVSTPALAVGLIVGTAGNDTLTVPAANATIANLILGLGGNDVLTGGSGADTMVGGAGNDIFNVSNVGQVIIAGTGVNTVQTTLSSYTLGANLENLTYTGTGNFTGTGNSLNNVITGGPGNDTFIATVGHGNDTFNGGGGTNTYDLSRTSAFANVNLRQVGGNGTATSVGNPGIDTLNSIQNVIGGSGGHDITGNGVNSVLTGGLGLVANSVSTLRDGVPANGSGFADMRGNSANDSFFVNSAKDIVTENFTGKPSFDTVFTSLSSYTLGTNLVRLIFLNSGNAGLGTGSFTGNANNAGDFIRGGNGPNILNGGTGNDTLIGGTGNDVLTGGAGNNVMTGGLGNDIFRYLAGNFKDIITDFTGHLGAANNQDRIDLSGLGITASASAKSFATSVNIAQFGATDTLVTVFGGGAAGGTIKLSGVLASAVNVTDFKLLP
jgi:Ca2+-binding RTX toxin-like protein